MRKNGKLCGNFRQYYAEESDDYAEKTPDYAEISKINKAVPLAFSNTKHMLTSYQEFNSFMTCLTFAAIRGQLFLCSTQFFHSFFSEA